MVVKSVKVLEWAQAFHAISAMAHGAYSVRMRRLPRKLMWYNGSMDNRLIAEQDRGILQESLANDQYHKDTTSADFFYDPRVTSLVYSGKKGPIAVLRCTKALRLDIQFLSNSSKMDKARFMIENFPALAERAVESGYTEIIFNTENPELKAFCEKKFGFFASHGEFRKLL